MRLARILILITTASAGFLTSGFHASAARNDTTAQQSQEKYAPLLLQGIPVVFRVAASSIYFENGKPVKGDPEVMAFAVGGHDIELVSNKLILEDEDYFVNTTKYGKMKVVFSGDFTSALWVTPSQRDALLKLAK